MRRKDKGDKAERARQAYWEDQGAVVFPVSPSYPGVDLIVFTADFLMLSEVKGQKAKLYGKTKAVAIICTTTRSFRRSSCSARVRRAACWLACPSQTPPHSPSLPKARRRLKP